MTATGAACGVVALACALVGGVLFAFSAFVLAALDELPPGRAIAAMQAINRTAVTPPFMAALFGTALACLVLAALALGRLGTPPAPWVLAGAAVYLVGTAGLTVVHHVPLNDALAAVDPGAADAATRWADFLGRWTPANHARALAALVAGGLLLVGAAA